MLLATPIQGFNALLVNSFLIIGAVAFTLSIATYVINILSLLWRKYITMHIHARYFSRLACYRVNNILGMKIDNP